MYLPFQSVSQWETSYFGGYYKVLEDHPEVSVSESIKIKPTENGDQYLFDDMKEKLLKLFIHTISVDKKLVQDLRTSTYSEPFESDGKYWVVMSKKSVNELLNKIINKRKEISLLFQYYKKTIIESDILFEVPPPKSKSDSKEGKDDSKKKGKSDKSKMKSDMSKPSEGTTKPNDNEGSIGNFTIPKTDLAESFEKEISKTELLKFIDDNTENISGHLKNKTEFVYMNKKNRNCIFSPSQVKFSNSLLSLLDISFDSKEAKLDNLMCGKMSSHKIAEVQAGNSRVYHKIEEDMETRPFTICVLGDESGSMEYEYDKSQNELFKILYRTFSQILPQDKMFFYGHSGYATPEIRVYHEPNYPFFENTIDEQLKNSYYENYDGPVIEKIYERVRSITDDNIIFIVISDGYPSGRNYGSRKDRENMKCVIEKCSRDGFVTMGVGLCHGGVEDLYKYYTIVDEMEDLVRNVSQLVNNVVKMEFQS